MPRIDPSIVIHEIKTYPYAKPIRHRLRLVLKAEVEKILKAGFIYLVPLTDWVSKIVVVNKK